MSVRLFEMLQILLKYSVVAGGLIFTLHVGLLLLGRDYPVADWLCGLSVFGFVALLMASYCLRFCALFRAFLGFDFVVSQCIRLQREIGLFGPFLQATRLIVFTTGVMLLTLLVIQNKRFIKCSTNKSWLMR